MDLRNHQITVGELLDNPRARQLLQKELPGIFNSPLLALAKGMRLQQVIPLAKDRLAPEQLQRLLQELAAL